MYKILQNRSNTEHNNLPQAKLRAPSGRYSSLLPLFFFATSLFTSYVRFHCLGRFLSSPASLFALVPSCLFRFHVLLSLHSFRCFAYPIPAVLAPWLLLHSSASLCHTLLPSLILLECPQIMCVRLSARRPVLAARSPSRIGCRSSTHTSACSSRFLSLLSLFLCRSPHFTPTTHMMLPLVFASLTV